MDHYTGIMFQPVNKLLVLYYSVDTRYHIFFPCKCSGVLLHALVYLPTHAYNKSESVWQLNKLYTIHAPVCENIFGEIFEEEMLTLNGEEFHMIFVNFCKTDDSSLSTVTHIWPVRKWVLLLFWSKHSCIQITSFQ